MNFNFNNLNYIYSLFYKVQDVNLEFVSSISIGTNYFLATINSNSSEMFVWLVQAFNLSTWSSWMSIKCLTTQSVI